MKAVLQSRYGSASALRLADIPRPTPAQDQILVRVRAVSLNGSDRENLRGWPLYVRFAGLLRPGNPIPGSDIAGVVAASGAHHTEFKPGDAVFGELPGYRGGLAEYVATGGKTLARKPADLSYAQAAAIPQAGVIAYRALAVEGKVGPGDRVLINGAGGSAGSFAVQLAKAKGAVVTGVDHGSKSEFLLSLGADHVLDYTKNDFTRTGEAYDLILDTIAHRSPAACARALAPGGVYWAVGGPVRVILRILLFGARFEAESGKRIRILGVPQNRTDLQSVTALCVEGKIKPAIDQTYALPQAPEAMRDLAAGNVNGKAVVLIDPPG